MSSSLLEAAFAHHVWATSRVIDACLDLSVEKLETSVLGTRGPILETLRHLVLNDTFDLFVLSGDSAFDIDDDRHDLVRGSRLDRAQRRRMGRVHSRPLDPDEMVHEVDKSDGFQRWAPVDSGSQRSWTTAPTTAVRSAQRSPRSVSSRQGSTSSTTGSQWAGSSRRCPTPRAALARPYRSPAQTPTGSKSSGTSMRISSAARSVERFRVTSPVTLAASPVAKASPSSESRPSITYR